MILINLLVHLFYQILILLNLLHIMIQSLFNKIQTNFIKLSL